MAILLQGAASLTLDGDSWIRPAESHSRWRVPTTAVIFETAETAKSIHYKAIGQVHFSGEYGLALIGQYLSDEVIALEP